MMVVLGLGTDLINSFTLMKYHSELASHLYYGSCSIQPKLPALEIEAAKQNDKFLLNWGVDTSLIKYIENFAEQDYEFQGYNVYQLASDLTSGISKKLASFDKIDSVTQINGYVMNPQTGFPEQGIVYSGTNSGIQHQFLVAADEINNTYFIPGKKYYFAVTAYAYNSKIKCLPNTIESLIKIAEITFSDTTVWANFGEVLQVTQTAGSGDAVIKPTVVDPYQLTNHTYKIFFSEQNDTLQWNLKDMTLGSDILLNQRDFSGDYTSPIVNGLQIRVNVDDNFKMFW